MRVVKGVANKIDAQGGLGSEVFNHISATARPRRIGSLEVSEDILHNSQDTASGLKTKKDGIVHQAKFLICNRNVNSH